MVAAAVSTKQEGLWFESPFVCSPYVWVFSADSWFPPQSKNMHF